MSKKIEMCIDGELKKIGEIIDEEVVKFISGLPQPGAADILTLLLALDVIEESKIRELMKKIEKRGVS